MLIIEAVIEMDWCQNNQTIRKHACIYMKVYFDESERSNFPHPHSDIYA
jgi:hypothetical protein